MAISVENSGLAAVKFKVRALLVSFTGLLFLMSLSASCADEQPVSEQAQQGRQIYSQSCANCHGDAASGDGAVPGSASHGPQGHTWHHPDQQLIDIVLGRLDYPGRKMPSFEGMLAKEQVEAVLAYLKTNWTAEQRAFQAEVTRKWEAQ